MTPGNGGLARRLGTGDAVVIGLGAMIGAGVFAAPGPAPAAAGSWLLAGLALAGVVAYVNATSSAQLAALYPESGGAYVYARRRLVLGILGRLGLRDGQDSPPPCPYPPSSAVWPCWRSARRCGRSPAAARETCASPL